MTENLLHRVLAKAAQEYGSAAARDFATIADGKNVFSNSIWAVAAESHGVPPSGWPADESRHTAEIRRIWRLLDEPLSQHVEHAQRRAYTGWSRHSSGPIRYAD